MKLLNDIAACQPSYQPNEWHLFSLNLEAGLLMEAWREGSNRESQTAYCTFKVQIHILSYIVECKRSPKMQLFK